PRRSGLDQGGRRGRGAREGSRRNRRAPAVLAAQSPVPETQPREYRRPPGRPLPPRPPAGQSLAERSSPHLVFGPALVMVPEPFTLCCGETPRAQPAACRKVKDRLLIRLGRKRWRRWAEFRGWERGRSNGDYSP